VSAPLQVAIDARVLPGVAGGVAVAVRSLIEGLGRLIDGDERYTIVVGNEAQREWVASFLGPNQRIVTYRRYEHPGVRGMLLRAGRPAAGYLRRLLAGRRWPEVPVSDGFHEGLGCDLVHWPTQGFTLCALPSVYNPHDLQHLQYPQFFTADTLAWRETVYPAGCHFAHTVVVGSQWIKDDVVRRYRVAPDKVQVIPEAAPAEALAEPSAADLARVARTHGFREPFVLYPGVAWPHKNHIRLFEALARLRDARGLRVPLVCTGAPYAPHRPRIDEALERLGLSNQVRFTGFLPPEDLRALYRLAACLVLPSLYEASSLPVFDAWLDGLPVACTNAAAMPQQVRDAGLLFDPHDVDAIAAAIATAMHDDAVRADLVARGRARVREFDLLRTARAYRAVYRRAGGLTPSEEDRDLLAWDWMSEVRAR
jgi:glycosyltransferase involved in cell wall biosynthesis